MDNAVKRFPIGVDSNVDFPPSGFEKGAKITRTPIPASVRKDAEDYSTAD